MGIFGGGYDKPGKGVDKNAPKKKGFFLFWEILTRKFTKLLKTNIMYSLTSILWIAALYLFTALILSGHMSSIQQLLQESAGDASVEDTASMMIFALGMMFASGIFMLWGFAPLSAPYAYIMRCYTRGEHAWIMSDGFSKFKENIKQSIVVLLIDILVLVLGINALYFYFSAYIAYSSMSWLILCYVTFLLIVVYTMIHPYLYQLMVTFDCSVRMLYKNAVLLTLGNLPINVLIMFIQGAIIYILFTYINPMFAMLLSLTFGLCVMSFPSHFYAARVIERSILNNMKEKTPSVKITYLDEDKIFDDNGPEEDEI